MFLKQKTEGHLIEVSHIEDLFNPLRKEIMGQLHYGEEKQDPELFLKEDLVFTSGEALPKCWKSVETRAGTGRSA